MNRVFCQGWEWNCIRISVLIALILPELAGLGILVALISIFRKNFQAIVRCRLNQGIGIVSLWLILGASLSPRPIDALLGLGNFLPFFFFFVNIRQVIQKPSQLRELAWTLVIPSVWVVGMGLGQLFLGWQKPDILSVIFTWPFAPGGEPRGRMSSVFMYANLLGIYLLMMLILAIGLWVATYRSRRLENNHLCNAQLSFLTLAIGLDSLGLFLTDSRNAWGLAFLAFLLFALYLGWRRLAWGFAGIAWIVSIASWGPVSLREGLRQIVPAVIWGRLSDEMFPDRPVATLRATQWKYTLAMTRQRPITGWGLRNFTPMYQADQGIWLGHPHNLYLMLMAETGIVGLILFCLWVGWIYVKGIRLWRFLARQKTGGELMLFTYLMAFGTCILFNLFDVTISEPKVNTLAWFLFAAIAGIVASAEREKLTD
jgi:O-antigen ligase